MLQTSRVDTGREASLLQQRHQRNGIQCHCGAIEEACVKVLNAHVERSGVDFYALGSTARANPNAL